MALDTVRYDDTSTELREMIEKKFGEGAFGWYYNFGSNSAIGGTSPAHYVFKHGEQALIKACELDKE